VRIIPGGCSALYGAFELKRHYRRNMLTGMATALMVGCVLIGTVWLASGFTYRGPDKSGDGRGGPIDTIIIDFRDDIEIVPDVPDGPKIAPPPPPAVSQPDFGKIVPVDGDFTGEDRVVIPGDYSEYDFDDDTIGGFGSDERYYGEGGKEGIPMSLPDPDIFVAVEMAPVLVEEKIPDYPRLAREGGFEGWVIVNAYVDREGKVIAARAARCNRPGIGFEEAAVKAAYECRYRPAIQNGDPAGIWISYKVVFTLQ